jgi:hypothetical protein
MRRYVEEVSRVNACDTSSPQFASAREAMAPTHAWMSPGDVAIPNLMGAWTRVLRFKAEVEGTRRILQMRAGEAPATASRCSDGSWKVTPNSVQFSRNPEVPDPGIVYPLQYSR